MYAAYNRTLMIRMGLGVITPTLENLTMAYVLCYTASASRPPALHPIDASPFGRVPFSG
jgi:hypothetical protein